jgi:hypothetical protein
MAVDATGVAGMNAATEFTILTAMAAGAHIIARRLDATRMLAIDYIGMAIGAGNIGMHRVAAGSGFMATRTV